MSLSGVKSSWTTLYTQFAGTFWRLDSSNREVLSPTSETNQRPNVLYFWAEVCLMNMNCPLIVIPLSPLQLSYSLLFLGKPLGKPRMLSKIWLVMRD